MKNKSSNSSTNASYSMSNYTRSKDAYDGNMEITNLKTSSQKLTGSVEPLPESSVAVIGAANSLRKK